MQISRAKKKLELDDKEKHDMPPTLALNDTISLGETEHPQVAERGSVKSFASESSGYAGSESADTGSVIHRVTHGQFSNFPIPKSVPQRASELRNKMAKDGVMRCAVAVHSVLRLAKSPSTKRIFPSISSSNPKFVKLCKEVAQPFEEEEIDIERQIREEVRVATRLRTQKKFGQLNVMRETWKKQGHSLRYVAKTAGMSLSTLWWTLVEPKSRRRNLVSRADQNRVIEFCSRTDVTMQIPFKRHSRNFYFRTAFNEVYNRYTNQMEKDGHRALSKSSMWRVLPARVYKPVSKVPYFQCLCATCENFKLASLAAVYAGLKGVSRESLETCMSAMCEVQETKDPKVPDLFQVDKLCLERRCPKCANKFSTEVTAKNLSEHWGRTVHWRQWEGTYEILPNGKNGKKLDFSRKKKQGTLAELFSLLKVQVGTMCKHLFDSKWQGEQFEILKKNLKQGEILQVMDFAKNVSFDRQREVQGGYWYRKNITLHPVVCYFLCPEEQCGQLVKDEVMCVSNDLTHDGHAVECYQNRAIEHLKKSGIQIDHVYQFTDNCSAQYKCYLPFGYISKFPLPLERHYFGAGHGKGPGDASVGRTKVLVASAIRGGVPNEDLTTADALAAHCQHALAISSEDGICCHSRRHFFVVNNIDRSYKCDIKTVPGTMQWHCVQKSSTRADMILTRKSSCFCR